MDNDKAQTDIQEIIASMKAALASEDMAGLEEIVAKSPTAITSNEGAVSARTLEDIAREVSSCQGCVLAQTRTKAVPGQGSATARLVFVGEAPGYEEDQQGLAFVGRAGQLLTKIIEAIGLKREDVFIGNIIKCRPPNNRNPAPEEIVACFDYLDEQLDLISPAVICTLGKFASQTLLETETPISRLRGQFHDFRGIPLMPTYHPAYLLRNPGEKRHVWEDMKKVRDLLASER